MEKILAGIVVVIVFCILIICGGCGTRPTIVATDEPIIGSQVSSARIEAINARLGDILRQYDGFVRGASERAIAGNIDAERALDEYDEFVQGLIRSLREIERETRTVETPPADSVDSGGADNSL